MTGVENVGVFVWEKFGSKIAWANQKEGGNPGHSSYLPAYEDGTDRLFWNDGIWNSDTGELPRRKHTIFRTWREFEI